VVPDSSNVPAEVTESRFPFRIERLGLAVDSGGPGRYRGGLGYEKHYRMLIDADFMCIADRSILACWGVKGGRAGKSFAVTIDPGGPREREIEGLVDAAPAAAGEMVRVRTTGGGGWGDPLDRPVVEVVRDVSRGKVSIAGARIDYGVVFTGSAAGPLGDGSVSAAEVDQPATDALRAEMRRARPGDPPFFDRGPGYSTLAGGRACAEVDHL